MRIPWAISGPGTQGIRVAGGRFRAAPALHLSGFPDDLRREDPSGALRGSARRQTPPRAATIGDIGEEPSEHIVWPRVADPVACDAATTGDPVTRHSHLRRHAGPPSPRRY